MGNATSSNKATRRPKKSSHKLSKPPISRYSSATAGLLSSDGCLALGTARRPNSSNTGGGHSASPSPSSRPSYPSRAASDIVSPGHTADALDHRLYRHPDFRQERPKSSLPRPKSSSQTESREQRRRTLGFTSPVHHSDIRRSQSTTNGVNGHPRHSNRTAESHPSSWCTTVNSSTYAPGDFRAYQPSRLPHLRESVNMHDYEFAVSDPKSPVLENTWKNSHPTTHPTSPGLSRANSDVSTYAPVRRRSVIRTPGVATRAPSASELARRTSASRVTSAVNSRRGSIDPGPELISIPLGVPGTSQERAVTPRDIDYGQLGTMKFGSLRITNGSPSPSDRKRGRDGLAGGVSGSESSLKSEPKEGRAVKPKIVEPKPTSISLTPVTATFLKLESGDHRQPAITSKDEKENLTSLLPGLSFGSFSLMGSGHDPPALQTISKHTAVEDDLFEDESPSTASDGVSTQYMDKPQGRTNRTRSDQAHKDIRQSGNRRDSGLVTSPISEGSYKPFSKTDSGYSSNVSIRSLRNSKGSTTDKDLPPFPAESSRLSVVDRPNSTTPFLGDFRLLSPRLLSLDDPKLFAPPGQEAPPPPPPPKDSLPAAPVNLAPAGGRPTAMVKPEAPVARTKTKKKTAPRPSYVLTSRNRATGPASPNSIQLSPALSNLSTSAPIPPVAVQKPGPFKRLLSVTSRKGSFSSLRSRSFRYSSSSSASRQSTTSPIPLHAKFFKDTRSAAGSGLSAMESVDSEKASDEQPSSRPASPEEVIIRRHRSLQSLPATIANAAVSVLPSRRSARLSTSSSVGETDDNEQADATADDSRETAENPEVIVGRSDRWSRSSSSGSDAISMENYTRDTLVRNGFDPSFMAMTNARDAYFSPAPSRAPSRAGSMASRRSEDMRSTRSKARSNSGSLASLDTRSSVQNTDMVDDPYLSSSHPLMRTRSLVQLRVPPLLRPNSTPSRLRKSQSQNFSPQPSCEHIYNYPLATASGRSSVDDTRPSLEIQYWAGQKFTGQHGKQNTPVPLNGVERHSILSRRPRSHGRTESVSSQGSSIGPYVRVMSASPQSGGQNLMPRRPSSANPYCDAQRQPQVLRHRASYESQTPSKTRHGQGYRRQSPNLWTSTHHEQLQMQYGGTALDPRGNWQPPYVPRSGGHYRNRSVASQGGSNAPYRVLHSYYTPAYRHAPIWG